MNIDPSIHVDAPQRPDNSLLKGIKHVIAVGSGKGGVGKSTTAVNLAFALKHLGAKVALLDADIYGPSIPKLLGLNEQPTQKPGQKVNPPEKFGVKCMSMALLGGDSPTIWRGPMASRAINQFLSEVEWGELDYLIIDLPPGTGDIQLTISQAARLSGSIIVSTPQELASEVSKRGLQMFEQVRVPVLGLVENMNGFACPHCDKVTHIFNKGGAEKVAKELDFPLLGNLPLELQLVRDSDAGTPVLVSRPESEIAEKYLELAKNMASELRRLLNGERKSALRIVNIEPNHKAKVAKITWNDNKVSLVSFKDWRFLCPCASCVDEGTGVRILKMENVDPNVHPQRIETVGNYAVRVYWSDGHNSGIYSFDYLRRQLDK